MNGDHTILWTVEQAVNYLPLPAPLERATLSKLGRDCAMLSRIWGHPIGQVEVFGKSWSHEKSYTSDVLQEVFSRHPATSAYVPKKEAQG